MKKKKLNSERGTCLQGVIGENCEWQCAWQHCRHTWADGDVHNLQRQKWFHSKHLYIIYLKTTFATKLDRQIQDKITFTKHKNPKAIYSSDFSKRNFHLGSMSTEFISTEQNWSAARVFAKCSLVASLPPVA